MLNFTYYLFLFLRIDKDFINSFIQHQDKSIVKPSKQQQTGQEDKRNRRINKEYAKSGAFSPRYKKLF